MSSRITGQSTVCSTFSSDKQHRNIKGPYYRPSVNGIHLWRKIRFHLMTLWCSKSPFLYKKPDIVTSSAATLTLGPEIGAHNWNTHKSTPNEHIKQEWCETIGKYLIKWLKTWIMIYLGAQNDPEIGSLGPIFSTPLKLAQIDMYTKTDAKPVEKFWENYQRPEFWLIWGPKVAQKLGLWGPYSPHI